MFVFRHFACYVEYITPIVLIFIGYIVYKTHLKINQIEDSSLKNNHEIISLIDNNEDNDDKKVELTSLIEKRIDL